MWGGGYRRRESVPHLRDVGGEGEGGHAARDHQQRGREQSPGPDPVCDGGHGGGADDVDAGLEGEERAHLYQGGGGARHEGGGGL